MIGSPVISALAHRSSKPVLSAIIAVVVFAIYSFTPGHERSGDNVGYYLGARSIVLEGDLDLDEYPSQLPEWAIYSYQGHVYSFFPILPQLLLVPFFEFAHFAGITREAHEIAAFAAVTFIALASFFLFLVFSQIAGEFWGAILTMGFAFCSPVFSNCASDFWSHVPALLFISISLFLALQRATMARIVAFGCFSGLAVVSRPQCLVAVVLLAVCYLSGQRRAKWIASWSTFWVIVGANAMLLKVISGKIGGTYFNQLFRNCFGTPALLSFLLSPSRGLLIYLPISLLALYEAIKLARGTPSFVLDCFRQVLAGFTRDPMHGYEMKLDKLAYISVMSVLASLLIHSSYILWTGGGCYGCRFATDLVPWAITIAAIQLHRQKGKALRVIIIALLLLGFLANLPGALNCAPYWCSETQVLDYWSFSRSQGYCAWREFLGLDNTQLLIQLSVALEDGDTAEPWALIQYTNPTRSKCVVPCIAVWGRTGADNDFSLCEVFKVNSMRVERGAHGELKLPLVNIYDVCPFAELRVDFAFLKWEWEPASNVASIYLWSTAR